MLAYYAADKIAKHIADQVCAQITTDATPNPTVVIYDQSTFNNILAYQALLQNVGIITKDYDNISGDNGGALSGAAAGSTGASGGLSLSMDPLSDFTGLLNAVAVASNTENYGSVVMPDSAMAIKAASYIHDNCGTTGSVSVAYPPLFGFGSQTATADVQNILKNLQTARENAHYAVATKLGTQFQNSEQSAQLTDVDGLYDALINSLIAAAPNASVAGLAAVAQGKAISDVLNPPITGSGKPAYVLLATVIAAGGTAHDHTNIWRKLWLGDQITYSGGIVVGFALWQAPGAGQNASQPWPGPKLVDVIRYRVPFVEAPAAPTGEDPMASSF